MIEINLPNTLEALRRQKQEMEAELEKVELAIAALAYGNQAKAYGIKETQFEAVIPIGWPGQHTARVYGDDVRKIIEEVRAQWKEKNVGTGGNMGSVALFLNINDNISVAVLRSDLPTDIVRVAENIEDRGTRLRVVWGRKAEDRGSAWL